MTDLFTWADAYPQSPGYKEPTTSRAAAESMKPTAGILRGRVLHAIEHSNGLTADECASRLSLTVLSVRPRFSELVDAGLIRDTGERRKNASGRAAKVWMAITPARLKPKGDTN